ncbi:2'-5' RNA ligase family protein [Phenylobacterium sp.]|uniref:2'-5' RNA ligase family protein n=1 Tax=Phenylobacterium sp. TaxID=1871053 RepID=UPI0028A21F66|nr:2'-5' RNA ligase family protein [Phenylobacterium sp.]
MRPGAEQLNFEFAADGLEPARRANLFFAIKPDRAAAARIVEVAHGLARLHALDGRVRRPERLHVSLVGLRAEEGALKELIGIAMALGAAVRWPTFEVGLHAGMTFGGGSRVLRCEHGASLALTGLRDAILATAEDCGLRLRGPSGFAPHVTVANDTAPMPETLLPAPICWRAQELLLLLNRGRGHVALASWPFVQRRGA